MNELTEQELVRREKIEKIREVTNPYPERYETNYELKDVKDMDNDRCVELQHILNSR